MIFRKGISRDVIQVHAMKYVILYEIPISISSKNKSSNHSSICLCINEVTNLYLFPQAPTPTRLCDNNSTSLNARTTMTSLRAPMEATPELLVTSGPAHRHYNITSYPFVNPLPTRTIPLPLKRTVTTLPQMTPSITLMLSTA